MSGMDGAVDGSKVDGGLRRSRFRARRSGENEGEVMDRERPPADESVGAEGGARSLAAKLDHLFRTVHPPGRGEYTYEEVSSAIAEGGGPTISGSYVWQLRKGVKDNPTRRNMEALCEFFGVPPGYFFDDALAERVDGQLRLLTVMRDAGVEKIMLRSAGLPTEDLDALSGMIEHLRSMRGLEANDEDAAQ